MIVDDRSDSQCIQCYESGKGYELEVKMNKELINLRKSPFYHIRPSRTNGFLKKYNDKVSLQQENPVCEEVELEKWIFEVYNKKTEDRKTYYLLFNTG